MESEPDGALAIGGDRGYGSTCAQRHGASRGDGSRGADLDIARAGNLLITSRPRG